jgi:hypothetical protein
MKGNINIKPVFLMFLTGRHWLNASQLKVKFFSLMYFYTKCRSNEPRISTPLQGTDFYQVYKTTLLTAKKGFNDVFTAFFLKLRGK